MDYLAYTAATLFLITFQVSNHKRFTTPVIVTDIPLGARTSAVLFNAVAAISDSD
jgi:hypothetical protein